MLTDYGFSMKNVNDANASLLPEAIGFRRNTRRPQLSNNGSNLENDPGITNPALKSAGLRQCQNDYRREKT